MFKSMKRNIVVSFYSVSEGIFITDMLNGYFINKVNITCYCWAFVSSIVAA